MARYRFVTDYRSHIGSFAAGDVIEFDDPALVAWIGRDVPGCIEPEPEPALERAVQTPPHDRQVRRGRNRTEASTP